VGGAAVLAVAAGVAGAVQVAVMGRSGERIGVYEALAWATVLSTVLAVGLLLLTRGSLGGLADAWRAPKWMWIGAAMGTFIVFTITVAGPRIGVVATTALLIAGQLAAATLIDRYGWFGVERVSVSAIRVVGLVLLTVGALLTLRR
jgi:transporter family-2 protein